jgi:hypothetical protein
MLLLRSGFTRIRYLSRAHAAEVNSDQRVQGLMKRKLGFVTGRAEGTGTLVTSLLRSAANSRWMPLLPARVPSTKASVEPRRHRAFGRNDKPERAMQLKTAIEEVGDPDWHCDCFRVSASPRKWASSESEPPRPVLCQIAVEHNQPSRLFCCWGGC